VFRDYKKNLAYLLTLLIPLFLIFAQTFFSPSLKSGIVRTVSVPIQIIGFPLKELRKILYYHRTYEEFKRLKQNEDVLKARLTGLEEVIRENARLEEILHIKRRLVYSSVVAHVIGRNPSLWSSSLIIDKGEEDGLRENQPVVNAIGVVGKIAEVSRKTAKVILLADPQFSVAALIQRSRESGLVTGTLQGLCRVRYLNPEADIQVGDKVITSKLSSSFPESLLVGEIIQIVEDVHEKSRECILQPAVSFSQIEEILVIIK